MEIKLGDRTYFIPDTCTSSRRRKVALRKDLQEHGAEAFLASHKLSPFARCVADELVEAGAELVSGEETAQSIEPPADDMEKPAPEIKENT